MKNITQVFNTFYHSAHSRFDEGQTVINELNVDLKGVFWNRNKCIQGLLTFQRGSNAIIPNPQVKEILTFIHLPSRAPACWETQWRRWEAWSRRKSTPPPSFGFFLFTCFLRLVFPQLGLALRFFSPSVCSGPPLSPQKGTVKIILLLVQNFTWALTLLGCYLERERDRGMDSSEEIRSTTDPVSVKRPRRLGQVPPAPPLVLSVPQNAVKLSHISVRWGKRK